MRKLGLVGGMGPESTIPYYHDIVYGVQKKIGQKIFPSKALLSIDRSCSVSSILALFCTSCFIEIVAGFLYSANSAISCDTFRSSSATSFSKALRSDFRLCVCLSETTSFFASVDILS